VSGAGMKKFIIVLMGVVGILTLLYLSFLTGAYSIYNNPDNYKTEYKTVEVPVYYEVSQGIPTKEIVYSSTLRKILYKELLSLMNNRELQEITNRAASKSYNCLDFALDYREFIVNKGIRCCVVEFSQEDKYGTESPLGHAIVAVDTIDKGLVYIEPQQGWEVPNIAVGVDYWGLLRIVGSSKGLRMSNKVGVDFISEIHYIW
jgi:hypothetical protein